MSTRNIVILGGGYAGLAAMRRLSQGGSRLDSLTLVDSSAWHCIKTRFHELVAGPHRDRLIRFPIRLFADAAGARFLMARIEKIDFRKRSVTTSEGALAYDRLVITLGGQAAYAGVRGAERHTVSLQSHESALECGRRVEALGLAARGGPRRRVVVCGAGLEGIEAAAMLGQQASGARCEILVLDRAREIMARSQCGPGERDYIKDHFLRNRIGLRLGVSITRVEERAVRLDSGERIEADLVIWCSGVDRARVRGLERGRPFQVNGFLQSLQYPEVFATGDFATVMTEGPYDNLFSAQRALYQAAVLAENMLLLDRGGPMRGASYRPRGELIALGDSDAVGVAAGIPLRGRAAALAKKANEALYLAELFRQVPASLLRRHLPAGLA